MAAPRDKAVDMLQKCGDDNELREWVEYQVIHTICFKKQPNVPTDESNDDTYACAYVIHNISELAGVGPAFKRMFKAYVFVKCSLCEFEPNPEIARPADSTWGHYLKNVQGQGSLCTIPRIYAAYLRGFDRGKDSGGQAWRWLARFLKTPPPAKTEGASPAVLQEFLKVCPWVSSIFASLARASEYPVQCRSPLLQFGTSSAAHPAATTWPPIPNPCSVILRHCLGKCGPRLGCK